MTREDIATLVRAFGDAAARAKAAGFDGVQFHGAHGYILSQFLSPHYTGAATSTAAASRIGRGYSRRFMKRSAAGWEAIIR